MTVGPGHGVSGALAASRLGEGWRGPSDNAECFGWSERGHHRKRVKLRLGLLDVSFFEAEGSSSSVSESVYVFCFRRVVTAVAGFWEAKERASKAYKKQDTRHRMQCDFCAAVLRFASVLP